MFAPVQRKILNISQIFSHIEFIYFEFITHGKILLFNNFFLIRIGIIIFPTSIMTHPQVKILDEDSRSRKSLYLLIIGIVQ